MTPFVLHHYDASRSPSLVTPFPSIVILNGRKNALWERQKTGQWHRVKNLLPWMTSYRFPHHDNRSFAIASDDALPWVLLYRQARKWLESRLCRLFNVILNGRKNALWERQKTGQWHRVKNLLPWMTSYRFPHHDNRSFAIAPDDALTSYTRIMEPAVRRNCWHT